MGCMYPLSNFSTKQSDVLAFSLREGGEERRLFLLFRFKKDTVQGRVWTHFNDMFISLP